MQNQEFTSRQFFKNINTIHLALLGGQFLFAMLALFLNSGDEPFGTKESDLDQIFQFLVPLAAIASLAASTLLWKKSLSAAKSLPNLQEKLAKYHQSFIVKLALMESSVLFSIICYLLTAQYLYLIIAALMMILFFFYRTSKERLISELECTNDEKKQLDNPDAVVFIMSSQK